MEPNPNIRVDSLDCFVGEFATDCNFGQNGIPNVLDKAPHLIDVTENSGVVSIYIDAKLCVTGSGANAPISAPDCVAVGAAQCGSGNGTYPITQDSVVGQAALYPYALTPTQMNNHFSSGSSTSGSGLPPSQQLGNGSSASPQVPQCKKGHPVNCATGNFTETLDEIAVPGRGSPLDLALTYNSLASSQNSPVGFGWSFSYGIHLTIGSGGSTATVILGDGNNVPFTRTNGAYLPPTWVIATLIQNPDGSFTYTEKRSQRRYVFSSNGQLTSEVDRNGYTTGLSYDSNGQLISVTDSSSRSFSITHTTGGNLATVTDPAGRTVSFAYDAPGNLTAVTDVGNGVTAFTYDTSHLLLTITDPRGAIFTNTYDANGRVITQVDAMNRKTSFAYGTGTTIVTDPDGNQTKQQFSNNELVASTHAYGTPLAATWTYTYDPITLAITSATDPNAHKAVLSWDSSANLLSVTDALNRTTTLTYDSLNDVTSNVDPAGNTTAYTYDANGNMLTESRPLSGTGRTQTATFQYGDSSHPGDVTSAIDPNGNSLLFSYNTNGDLISTVDALGEKATLNYDSIGRKTSSITPNGNVSGANPSLFTTAFSYNPFGDVTSIIDPLGHTTSIAYDPNQNAIKVTDPNKNATQYTYDADNELVKLLRPDGTVLANGYEADGRLSSQTDGNNNTTAYAYDALGRLMAMSDPLGRTTLYSYDGAGNLIALVNASGAVTTMAYDAANQLVGVAYSTNTAANVTFAYDAAGRRTSMTDGTGTTTYTYDSLSRLLSVKDGSGSTAGYTYDLNDNLIGITYPGGKQVNYQFNAANEMTAVTDWLNHTTSFGYDANRNLGTQSYPNGTTASLTYNATNQLLQIVDSKSAGNFASFSYARDNAGQVTSATPTGVGQGSETYTYTPLNQLAAVNGAAYKYDAGDNITQLPSNTNLSYDTADQLGSLSTGGPNTTFTYDAQGNRISMGLPSGATTSYAYDQANRLIRATTPVPQGTVAAGAFHSLAVRNDGTVWAWGLNSSGQLGNGGTAQSNVPVQVSNLSGVKSIAGGSFHSIALKSDGSVWDWGNNQYGQLGNGTTKNSSTPVQVQHLSGLIAVAGGCAHSLALKNDGTVWAWGSNQYGQLGNASTANSSTPVPVKNVTGVIAIAAGCLHSIALKSDGTVWAWGGNQFGQLGNGTTVNSSTAVQVAAIGSVTSIGAGALHSLAVRSDGTAWAWGNNQFGQLGNGSTGSSLTPAKVATLNGVVALSGGSGHTLAVTSTGAVWAWGLNNAGQLGNGTRSNSSIPVHVNTLPSSSVVAAGAAHSLASTSGGAVWAWGDNSFGELGNGTTTSSSTPAPISVMGSTSAQGTTTYAYNGDGLRTGKTVNNVTESFSWGFIQGLPLVIQDAGTSFIYGPGDVPVEQVSASGTPLYLHQDQLGSTRLLTDATGAVAGTYSYAAYGATVSHTGSAVTPLQFAGQYFDSETGFYYLRARYFDPGTAQFVSRDPLVAATRQPYAYVGGNPLNHIDPMGLVDWWTLFVAFSPAFGPLGDIFGVISAGFSLAAILNPALEIGATIAGFISAGFSFFSAAVDCSNSIDLKCAWDIGSGLLGLAGPITNVFKRLGELGQVFNSGADLSQIGRKLLADIGLSKLSVVSATIKKVIALAGGPKAADTILGAIATEAGVIIDTLEAVAC
jgi:RHS repeat-associated protein